MGQVYDRVAHRLRGEVTLPGEGGNLNVEDPSGIALCGEGRISVVQYGLDRMLNIDFDAGSLEASGVQDVSSQLYGPFGVGFVRGRSFVADSCNHRCLVQGMKGEVLFEFGSHGTGPGEFKYPVGVSVFNDGHVAVTDKDNHRIQIFD